MQDVSRMSNQERIAALGVEEADKYRGPYNRRYDGLKTIPSINHLGGVWYVQQIELEQLAKKMGVKPKRSKTPKEYIFDTQSFKKNRPAPKEQKSPFTKKDIKGRHRNRHVLAS